jgi:NAD(P)-dependent dehydrogenase (short-subunit alcohol dehydrogenase family)
MTRGRVASEQRRNRHTLEYGRLGRSEEIAAAGLWRCCPGASFVIGVALPVDGGFTAH